MAREFHYDWRWTFKSSPEALWEMAADTNRFNRDTGLPTLIRPQASAGSSGPGLQRLLFYRLGVPVEWDEEPFEWERPFRFGVLRRYHRGPVAWMRVLVELEPNENGGTDMRYRVWVSPANALGLLAIPVQIGLLSARAFASALRSYDELLARGGAPVELPARARFAPHGRERLAALETKLVEQGVSAKVAAKFVQFLATADDTVITRLRPYVLADAWGLPRRLLLDCCLRAARQGVLDLRWDVICPLCRGAKASAPTLAGMPAEVHCESCMIDYRAEFDRSVELSFRIHPSVRRIESSEYCIGGPQVTPHIAMQQLLDPGQERALSPALTPGRYRARALGRAGGMYMTVEDGDGLTEARPAAELRIGISAAGWPAEEPLLPPRPQLLLHNETGERQLFILELLRDSGQALKASEVASSQLFRDLFAREVLRPGESSSISSQTLVFTDLRGSTALYQRAGDGPAFGAVMDHFAVLRECVDEHGGALVKTMGDAVLAVFGDPAQALYAVLDAQLKLAALGEGAEPLTLKAGIHSGPCIAVTLNERLDYLGSSVNLAARLTGLCEGADAVISEAVYNDPRVAELLSVPTLGLSAAPDSAELRGFEPQRFPIWRVSRKKG